MLLIFKVRLYSNTLAGNMCSLSLDFQIYCYCTYISERIQIKKAKLVTELLWNFWDSKVSCRNLAKYLTTLL